MLIGGNKVEMIVNSGATVNKSIELCGRRLEGTKLKVAQKGQGTVSIWISNTIQGDWKVYYDIGSHE